MEPLSGTMLPSFLVLSREKTGYLMSFIVMLFYFMLFVIIEAPADCIVGPNRDEPYEFAPS